MANTDFFDDDLNRQRDAAKRLRMGAAEPIATIQQSESEETPVRPVSDFNLSRMAKHKSEVDEQVVTAMQELERLKKRQEDLEHEKRDLEEMRRKQEEYERGRREMIERFTQSLITLEKDELQAERLAELLSSTRKRFKSMLDEIQGINEEYWPENQFREELNKALVILEDARMEYNKSMSKVDAIGGAAAKPAAGEHQPVIFEEGRASEVERGFAYWLKMGFAASLPMIVTLVIITIAVLILNNIGMY